MDHDSYLRELIQQTLKATHAVDAKVDLLFREAVLKEDFMRLEDRLNKKQDENENQLVAHGLMLAAHERFVNNSRWLFRVIAVAVIGAAVVAASSMFRLDFSHVTPLYQTHTPHIQTTKGP